MQIIDLDRSIHKHSQLIPAISGPSDDGQIFENLQIRKQNRHKHLFRKIHEETVTNF